MPFYVKRNVDIRDLHSFRFPIIAKVLLRLEKHSDIIDSLPIVRSCNSKVFLGSGSNTVFTKNYNGCVIHMAIKGKKILTENESYVMIQVAAGESWPCFVDWTLENNYPGLENLSMIPGTVGAAPVQNIGAYGVEIKPFIHGVIVFNYKEESFHYLLTNDLDLQYRWSKFKRTEWKKDLLITDVIFKLPKQWAPCLRYQNLGKILPDNPSPREIGNAICAIRKKKIPAITDKQFHAGSFFRNLVVSQSKIEHIKGKYPDVPIFSDTKIPAAWLLEKRGWKGHARGNVGVSKEHALVLVHNGQGKAEELLELSSEIQKDILTDTGVLIQPEVVIHGSL